MHHDGYNTNSDSTLQIPGSFNQAQSGFRWLDGICELETRIGSLKESSPVFNFALFSILYLPHADVYFFKWIFHDWSDKYCIKILRALIPALKKGARIVVNEFIVPAPGTLPTHLEAGIR